MHILPIEPSRDGRNGTKAGNDVNARATVRKRISRLDLPAPRDTQAQAKVQTGLLSRHPFSSNSASGVAPGTAGPPPPTLMSTATGLWAALYRRQYRQDWHHSTKH
jgi:hypothetical protein